MECVGSKRNEYASRNIHDCQDRKENGYQIIDRIIYTATSPASTLMNVRTTLLTVNPLYDAPVDCKQAKTEAAGVCPP